MKKQIIPLVALGVVVACKKEVQKPVPNVIDSMAQAKSDSAATTVKNTAAKEAALKQSNDEVLMTLKIKIIKLLLHGFILKKEFVFQCMLL